jgi:hypothetical protein
MHYDPTHSLTLSHTQLLAEPVGMESAFPKAFYNDICMIQLKKFHVALAGMTPYAAKASGDTIWLASA